ncbi:MAG TPA: PQQ-binding-like beta-propeller repeat protein, partial [Verrucomicrobiae bacterium]|nr:PQQ-binding-like beta-propeller repeat protein [Verrucomicrobiae bacterium]
MKTRRLFQLVFPILALSAVSGNPADWPQFRGPGGNAISETAVPPVAFGPSTNVFWKTPLPSGYSSPVVTGDLVFVTSDEAGLETLALSRKDGRILWRKAALAVKTDSRKKTNDSPGRASSTPATDGTFVFVFFGKAGLIAYDLQGTERWRWSPPAPDPEISASPILIDDKVIIVCD